MQDLINRLIDAQVALVNVCQQLDNGVEPNANGSDADDFQHQIEALKVQLRQVEELGAANGLTREVV